MLCSKISIALFILLLGFPCGQTTSSNADKSNRRGSKTSNKKAKEIEVTPPIEKTPPSRSGIFGPDETKYEKFAACVAASGMSVRQFNQIGKEVVQNPRLEEKVLKNPEDIPTKSRRSRLSALDVPSHRALQVVEQACLYQMAAHFKSNQAKREAAKATEEANRNRVFMFCESLSEISKLQEEQMNLLKRSLNVDKFPERVQFSDSSIKPFLSPKVRAVIDAFPLQAEEIVRRNGLDSESFNEMLKETKSNPSFRGLVERYMSNDSTSRKSNSKKISKR